MIGGLCVRVRGRWLLGPIVVCVGVIGGCLGVAIGLSGQFISLLLYDENRSELINRHNRMVWLCVFITGNKQSLLFHPSVSIMIHHYIPIT